LVSCSAYQSSGGEQRKSRNSLTYWLSGAMVAVATGCSRHGGARRSCGTTAGHSLPYLLGERSHRQPRVQQYGGEQMARAIAPGATGQAGLLDRSDPTYQAWQLLHIGFTVAPIVAGLDKFFGLLVNWDQ